MNIIATKLNGIMKETTTNVKRKKKRSKPKATQREMMRKQEMTDSFNELVDSNHRSHPILMMDR